MLRICDLQQPFHLRVINPLHGVTTDMQITMFWLSVLYRTMHKIYQMNDIDDFKLRIVCGELITLKSSQANVHTYNNHAHT